MEVDYVNTLRNPSRMSQVIRFRTPQFCFPGRGSSAYQNFSITTATMPFPLLLLHSLHLWPSQAWKVFNNCPPSNHFPSITISCTRKTVLLPRQKDATPTRFTTKSPPKPHKSQNFRSKRLPTFKTANSHSHRGAQKTAKLLVLVNILGSGIFLTALFPIKERP